MNQDKRQSQGKLRQSRELFRLISENVTDLIAVINLEGQPLYYNPAIQTLLEEPEISGELNFFDRIHPDDREQIKQVFQQTLSTGQGHRTEYRLLRKDDSIRYLESQVNTFQGKHDPPAKIIVVARDITERKEAEQIRIELEEQLRHSQKFEAIGRLAGGVAHEFSNQLTAVISYADLVLETLSPDEPAYRDIQGIKKSAGQAASLTQKLLAFASRQITRPKVLTLTQLINEMDELLRPLISKSIELLISSPPDLGRIKADPHQLKQVLVNLAINAEDALPEGGKLIIETANVNFQHSHVYQHGEIEPGDYVMLAVSDTGIGMNSEVKAHLFEPFFTTKGETQGTGLGLATCFGIVKQNNGHILVYSEPGQGTTFKIYFPQVGEGINRLIQRQPAEDLPGGTETILVADDEAIVRTVMARILRRQGYTVLEATNGEEALRLAQEQADGRLHLVLTDILMPQLGGRALVNGLQTAHPNIKVLYISGYTDEAIIGHGLLDPGAAFLQKPFEPEILARKVRDILDQ